MGSLLEMYSFLHYEAKPDLANAILNNWLVNLTGQPGHWIERDLMQEHHNKYTEEMVGKHGGDFDDPLHRDIISPNVDFFNHFKVYLEEDFQLKRRGKSHTSPHLRAEYKSLLNMYKEEDVRKFSSGRSLGHAAVSLFNKGYTRLNGGGRMQEFLRKSTEYATVLKKIEETRVSLVLVIAASSLIGPYIANTSDCT